MRELTSYPDDIQEASRVEHEGVREISYRSLAHPQVDHEEF